MKDINVDENRKANGIVEDKSVLSDLVCNVLRSGETITLPSSQGIKFHSEFSEQMHSVIEDYRRQQRLDYAQVINTVFY